MAGSHSTTTQRLKKQLELASWLGNLGKNAVLDLVLPPSCRFCNRPVSRDEDFCGGCLRSLTISEPMMRSSCLRCGRPRPKVQSEQAELQASELEPCAQCRSEKLLFRCVVPLWSYQDRVCEAVVAAKYAHQSPLAAALGTRLGDRIVTIATDAANLFDGDLSQPDLVTYVPSHLLRQLRRGGNGTRAIAEAVCDRLRAGNCRVSCRSLLTMTRQIKKQAWLDNQQRRENVRGAFAVKRSYVWAKSLVNRHILLVDDVLTTGATANEVTRMLLGSGAKSVTLAVVARAIRSQ